jgi:hypothetical protein
LLSRSAVKRIYRAREVRRRLFFSSSVPHEIISAMDGEFPLTTLLSQVLVAFTIEFDNEAERRMPASDHGLWRFCRIAARSLAGFHG